MADKDGAGTAGPSTLTITEGGITVEMLPCGFRDLIELPRELDRLGDWAGKASPEDEGALQDAMLAFAERVDAYAAGPVKPSRVPLSGGHYHRFVTRWTQEVRDAALPPASAGGSRKRPSTTPRARHT